MSGSDPVLLADTEAFWVAYDAAETEAERQALHTDWLRAHGAREATREDVKWNRASHVGELMGGLYPVRA